MPIFEVFFQDQGAGSKGLLLSFVCRLPQRSQSLKARSQDARDGEQTWCWKLADLVGADLSEFGQMAGLGFHCRIHLNTSNTLLILKVMPSIMKLALAGALTLATALQVNAAAYEARHGLDADKFQKVFDELEAKNYSLVDVNGYTDSNSPRFAGIFVQHDKKPDFVARAEVNAVEYHALFLSLRAEGYRPQVVDGYTVDGEARFASIWDKSSKTAWQERTQMSASGFQRVFDQLVDNEGYRLTYVSGYAVGKEARYAAIWEKVDDKTPWVARFGLTAKRYQEEFDKNLAKGFRPIHVNGYTVDGETLFAAIWEKSDSAFQARHGLTPEQYQKTFDELSEKGYVLSVVSGYESDDCVKYAAIWNKA
ncbi:hypothetical protein FQN52_002168 [Onygenales sp. PD_12]|nr:hypothetical protein FQN52_002168 [Onygenales sp. PD_12]